MPRGGTKWMSARHLAGIKNPRTILLMKDERKPRPVTSEARLKALAKMDPAERAARIRLPVVSIQKGVDCDEI